MPMTTRYNSLITLTINKSDEFNVFVPDRHLLLFTIVIFLKEFMIFASLQFLTRKENKPRQLYGASQNKCLSPLWPVPSPAKSGV